MKNLSTYKNFESEKYYKNLKGSTIDKRRSLFNKQSKMSNNDPNAYKTPIGDTKGKKFLKQSKHTKKYKRLYEKRIDSDKIEKVLMNKSKATGIPIEYIRKVMRRGMAAWKSGHRPGATQVQWGYARVNSFLTKSKTSWYGSDSDISKEIIEKGLDKKLKS